MRPWCLLAVAAGLLACTRGEDPTAGAPLASNDAAEATGSGGAGGSIDAQAPRDALVEGPDDGGAGAPADASSAHDGSADAPTRDGSVDATADATSDGDRGDVAADAGTSARDLVWIVGTGPNALHWDGSSLRAVPTGTSAALNGVWGSATDNVWAVGEEGTIIHWDGRSWRPVSSGVQASLRVVWGSGPDDVWVVGMGALLHWNGTSWTQEQPLPFDEVTDQFTGNGPSGIWGSGPNDVWICARVGAGSTNTFYHYNGTAWTFVPYQVEGDTDLSCEGIWGIGPHNVWAVGHRASTLHDGRSFHWNGSAWTRVYLGTGYDFFGGIWGTGKTDIWVSGWFGLVNEFIAGSAQHYNLRAIDRAHDLPDIMPGRLAGRASDDVWLLGNGFITAPLPWRPDGRGTRIFHFDGIAWTEVPSGTTARFIALWALPR